MWSREAVIGGAALALAGDLVLRQRAPRARLTLQGVGLVTAAGIYPALHKGPADADERNREVAGLAAAAAVVTTAAILARRPKGKAILAAGWAAHALFDARHRRSETSLLPDWYPAVCAGYDVATAAAILAPARGAHAGD